MPDVEDGQASTRAGGANTEGRETADDRYRQLFEGLPIGLYRSTIDGRLLDVNPALVRILGYPDRETLLATPLSDIYADPADRQRLIGIAAELRGGAFAETQLRRYDGSLAWVRIGMHAVRDTRGVSVLLEGAVEDIAEQKAAEEAVRRSEARFRSLIETSYDTITIIDGEGRILYDSPGVDRALGIPAGGRTGTHIGERVHPDDTALVRAAWERLLRNAPEPISLSYRVVDAEGRPHFIEATARNLIDDPAVGGVVVNARDVTERVRLEEDLRQAQKMEALGRLAGGVAHDFNNILTAVSGNLQFVLEQLPADSPLRPELSEIEETARRATTLTRQLLALSRRQVLQPRLIDINECVLHTERMLRRTIGEHIQFRTHLARDPGAVRADPGQVEQVLINLVLNARDAMPTGGWLTVATRGEDVPPHSALALRLPPGRYVVLSVTDTGRGIRGDHLPHIFEPFFTTKDSAEGTGLGLSVVYSIVSQSGGAIDVSTDLGRGSSFNVYLPRAEGRPEPGSVVQAPRTGPSAPRRILLVEDDPTVRSLAARVLTAAGHHVVVAEDGPAALRMFQSEAEPPDLLVTDVVMPGLNGWELGQMLQARRPELKVLLVSGYTREVVLPPERLGDTTFFLEKPFSPEGLRAAVAKACR